MPIACRDIQEGFFITGRVLHSSLPWARGGTHSTLPAGFRGTVIAAEIRGRAAALAAEQCDVQQHKPSWSYTSHPQRVVAAPPRTTVSLYGSSEIPLMCLECVLTKTDQEARPSVIRAYRADRRGVTLTLPKLCCNLSCDTLTWCKPLC